MAGPRGALPLLLLLSAALGVLLPPCGSSPAAGPPKVSLALYYESLCPYCSRFIVNRLAGIFDDGLIDAVDLRLVPYGNAHVLSGNKISCQPSSLAHSLKADLLAELHHLPVAVSLNTVEMVPMASGRLCHLILLLLAALLLLGASQAAAGGVKKVRVALYYESLCPYSARFVVDRLAKVFEDGLVEAADLALLPYGNAKVGKDGAISCQHGPDECLLNTVEACAIDVWPDLNVHFSFINCVEGLVMKRMHQQWKSCFAKLGLDTKPFAKCYESERGHKLSLKFGKETDALVPPHKYVPWVVVDGQPLYDDYENFEVYVCKAYKGPPPKVCQGLVHRRPVVQEVVEAGGGVSYNSGDNDLGSGIADDDSVEDKIKMVLPDDDN